MAESPDHEVTSLLQAWSAGDQQALDKLAPLVYEELHRAAHRYMAREHTGHTLQTTALVNEVYLRLVNVRKVDWQCRAHFYAISARMMRRVLTDFARSRRYLKRGRDTVHLPFEEALFPGREEDPDIVDLDEALNVLASMDQRKTQVVELRFLAWVKYEYDWNFKDAEQEFKRALEFSPGNANIHLWYGNFLVQTGRVGESLAEFKIAQTLDPLSPIIGSLAATPLIASRRYDDAIASLQKVLELAPSAALPYFYLQTAYEGKGDYPNAIDAAGKLALGFGDKPENVSARSATLRGAYAKSGPRGYWLAQLESLKAGWKKNPGDGYPFAPVYARLGDKDKAFEWLDKAYAAHSQELTFSLLVEPSFDSLHSDPRFDDLLRRMGRTTPGLKPDS